MNTLSIFIATTLHVFTVSAGVDADGKPVELNPEMSGAVITYVFRSLFSSLAYSLPPPPSTPKYVPCGFKPRSEAAERLIRANAAEDA